jgi:hypothetical protein
MESRWNQGLLSGYEMACIFRDPIILSSSSSDPMIQGDRALERLTWSSNSPRKAQAPYFQSTGEFLDNRIMLKSNFNPAKVE